MTSDDPDAMEDWQSTFLRYNVETGGFSSDKSQGQKALPDNKEKEKDKDKILKALESIVCVADVINNASKMKSGLEGLATKVGDYAGQGQV